MAVDKCVCEHCGAPMYKYWHNLNRPLCKALFELYKIGGPANIGHIGLSHGQINNFTKLQHWDLVEHLGTGSWVITEIGRDFCRGKIQIPKAVKTYRGEREEESRALVKIDDVLPEEYKQILAYIADREPVRKPDDQINFDFA